MAKRIGNPDVDWYFTKPTAWQEEFRALRALACATGLTEELKWGHPCYTLGGKNVVLMHGFKDYCALLFHKGSLLKDTAGLLVQQTANVQVQRQLRFGSRAEITKQSKLIDRYIREAAALEKEGRRAEYKPTAAYAIRRSGEPYSTVAIPELDRLLDESRRIVDPAARATVLERIQRRAAEQVPMLTLYQEDALYGKRKNVNFQGRPDARIPVFDISLR